MNLMLKSSTVKKCIAICMSILMIFSSFLFQSFAYADEEKTDGIFKYIDDGSKVCILGLTESVKDLVIPSTIKGKAVTEIDSYAFSSNDDIESVTIPGSIKTIASGAFAGCENMTTAILNAGTTKIDNDAFRNCYSLNSITIPNTVTMLGDDVFCNSVELRNIDLPQSLEYIGGGTFEGCWNLQSITIPKGVTFLGDEIFGGCESLTSIVVDSGNTVYDSRNNCNAIIETATNTLLTGCSKTLIPNSVKKIQYGAFSGCLNLTEIVIPSGVTSIGEDAFYQCKNLISINMPNTITELGDRVFYGCYKLKNISLQEGITKIGEFAFSHCTGLENINIPNSVQTIAYGAFSNCSSLTEIVISKGVTVIERDVFSSCNSLKSIKVDSENTVYDSRDNCNAIIETATDTLIVGCSKTTIPNTVKVIGKGAFSFVNGITNVTIPEGVTKIDESAFSFCDNLKNVTIPDSVTSIGSWAFEFCPKLTSINIPKNVTSLGDSLVRECNELSSISVDSENTVYDSRNNCNAIIETATNTLLYGCKSTVIPEDILAIKDFSFAYCLGLKSIVIPKGVTKIGDGAFMGCSGLTSIVVDSENTVYDSRDNCNAIIETATNTILYACSNTVIPDTVTNIDSTAFGDCPNLKDLYIPASLERISDMCFYGCSGLKSIRVDDDNPYYDSRNDCNALIETSSNTLLLGCENTVIPNSVTRIAGSAFENCAGLKSIVISKNIEDIGFGAFFGCTGLTSIVIEDGNKVYDSRDNCNAIIETKSNRMICACNNTVIPTSVSELYDYALNNCESMASIVIPENIKYLYKGTFYKCKNLKSITVLSDYWEVEEDEFDILNNADIYIIKGSRTEDNLKKEGIEYEYYEVEKIEVTTLPDKKEYFIGDNSLDLKGGKVTKTYTNGDKEIVDLEASMVSGFNSTNAGKNTLTVTVDDKTTSFDVVIKENDIKSIKVTTMPKVTEYLEAKDELDLSGGKVTKYYENGTTSVVDLTSDMVDGFDNTIPGTNTITVTIGENTTTFNVTIKKKSLKEIKVTKKPDVIEYLEAKDKLDLTGGKVTKYYDNDTEEVIDLTSDMVEGFDNRVPGTNTLTVTVDGKKTTFDVTIKAKSLKEIKVTKLPNVTTYLEAKDKLNLTGGKVTKYYDNDTTEVVDLTSDMVDGFDNTVPGTNTITVTIGKQKTTFDVTIKAKSLKEIKVTKLPNVTTYLEAKDKLDLSGGKVTKYYDNDTTEVLDLTLSMVSGFDNTVPGIKTLTVTVDGKKTTFDVTIKAKSLDHIAVTTMPNVTEYLEAKDKLDLAGGKVTKYFDNDTTEVLDLTLSMVSGFDNTVPGTNTLTVTVDGKKTTFDVTIKAKSLVSISVTKMPIKREYIVQYEDIDLTGGEVTKYFDNDTKEVVALAPSMIHGYDNSKVGPSTVLVYIDGKMTTFDVTIRDKALTKIEVSKLPTKLEYLEAKDELDLTGGEVTKYYDNDTTEILNLAEEMVTGFNNKVVGTNTLTVTLDQKTTTFDVTIKAKSLDHIKVTKYPDKMEYIIDVDEFDVTGGEVTKFFNNDTKEVIPMEASMVSGFDNSSLGYKEITVTVDKKDATFNVSIVDTVLTSIQITNLPSKLEYIEGQIFDNTDLEVTAFYEDETSKVIEEGYNVLVDTSVIGTNTATVSYNGQTDSFDIEVIKKSLLSISMEKLPVKTKYIRGNEDFDVTGAVIRLFYNNDTSETMDVSLDMIEEFDKDKIGDQTITVTFEGKETSFTINVYEEYVRGDMNNDGEVTDQDAIYLLYYTFFPSKYPILQSGDVNGDGEVTDQDAIYLLYYTFFPEKYPLS